MIPLRKRDSRPFLLRKLCAIEGADLRCSWEDFARMSICIWNESFAQSSPETLADLMMRVGEMKKSTLC